MLTKLLKYEFKATGRIMAPIYAAAILMSIITAFFFNINNNFKSPQANVLTISTLVLFIIFVCVITSAIIFSYVISIYRFKKNIFDSEGYLMHTLPVTSEQNIFSKLIVSVIYQCLSIIVAILAASVFLIISTEFGVSDLFKGFALVLDYVFNTMTGQQHILLLEIIASMVLGLVLFNIEVYAAISIGHSAAEHKILKSFGAYMVFGVITNMINTILILPLFMFMINADPMVSGKYFFLYMLLVSIVYIAMYYIITNYFIKKKLNLQ